MNSRAHTILGALAVAVLFLAAFVQQAQAAGVPAATASVTITAETPHVTVVHTIQVRYYRVRPGDSLSRISEHYYGAYRDWPTIYNANRSRVHNPDLILAGWTLIIPRHVTATAPLVRATPHRSSRGGGRGGVTVTGRTSLSGTLSYAGLERLWESAGGPVWAAPTAACIAEHESGGRQYATGGAGERGYWQIHPDHGALSTYNAFGNARAAVIISSGGRNWSPWTTHVFCGV
jgi:LysM repeat protein